jgi:hypothetical protein
MQWIALSNALPGPAAYAQGALCSRRGYRPSAARGKSGVLQGPFGFASVLHPQALRAVL